MIRSCLWHSVSQMVNCASRWSSPRDTQRSFDRGPPSARDGIPVSSRLFLLGHEPTVGSPHRVTVSDWVLTVRFGPRRTAAVVSCHSSSVRATDRCPSEPALRCGRADG